jgi:hypothetical protein
MRFPSVLIYQKYKILSRSGRTRSDKIAAGKVLKKENKPRRNEEDEE